MDHHERYSWRGRRGALVQVVQGAAVHGRGAVPHGVETRLNALPIERIARGVVDDLSQVRGLQRQRKAREPCDRRVR